MAGPLPISHPTRTRLVAAVALCAGVCALASSALAQAPDLGAAVAGGTGMRGTDDPAVDTGVDDSAPVSNTANLSVPPVAAAPKLGLPKLKNGALPLRYPVPLPILQAYRARIARARANQAADLPDVIPGPTVAVLPPPPPRRTIPADENPFGPIGYDVLSTRIFPYVQEGLGYDSNPEQVSTGVKGSAFSRTEGGMAIQSDWANHELKGTLRAGYDEFFSNPRANRPDANGVIDLRIDVTRDTKLDAETRFNVDTQRPDSPELNVSVGDRPLIASYGGTFGATQNFGRFSVGLHGLIDRTTYDDGELSDGTPVALAYQDVNDYGVKARLGYDMRPGFLPFVEIGYDQRLHDQTIDPFGYRRDSDGIGGRIGSSFELWPQLTGTASVGYATRSYDDPRLKDLTGPTAAASLAWAVTPLTTLTVQANTAFDETTVVGASGIETRVVDVALSHALFRYLTITGDLAFQRNAYVGVSIVEDILTASLKADYHLTRSLVLTGTLSHQQLTSTIKGSDYTQNVALVGLRFQH